MESRRFGLLAGLAAEQVGSGWGNSCTSKLDHDGLLDILVGIRFYAGPFVIGLSGVAIGVYIACSRHFDTMLSALSNSTWARQQDILGTTSLASRFYLVGTLSGALLFPQYLVRKGMLDAGDVSNFLPPCGV